MSVDSSRWVRWVVGSLGRVVWSSDAFSMHFGFTLRGRSAQAASCQGQGGANEPIDKLSKLSKGFGPSSVLKVQRRPYLRGASQYSTGFSIPVAGLVLRQLKSSQETKHLWEDWKMRRYFAKSFIGISPQSHKAIHWNFGIAIPTLQTHMADAKTLIAFFVTKDPFEKKQPRNWGFTVLFTWSFMMLSFYFYDAFFASTKPQKVSMIKRSMPVCGWRIIGHNQHMLDSSRSNIKQIEQAFIPSNHKSKSGLNTIWTPSWRGLGAVTPVASQRDPVTTPPEQLHGLRGQNGTGGAQVSPTKLWRYRNQRHKQNKQKKTEQN